MSSMGLYKWLFLTKHFEVIFVEQNFQSKQKAPFPHVAHQDLWLETGPIFGRCSQVQAGVLLCQSTITEGAQIIAEENPSCEYR